MAQKKTSTQDITQIQHIIFLVRENRSFDNLFGAVAGADGASTAKISTGVVVPMPHGEDQFPRDVSHDQIDSRIGLEARWMPSIWSGINTGRNYSETNNCPPFWPEERSVLFR